MGNGLALNKLPSINEVNTNNNNNNNNNNNPPSVSSNCRFIHNDHTVVTSGALFFRPYYGDHTIRENLYVSNKASLYGGAMEYNFDGTFTPHSATFYFCFFSENDGNDCGNDVIFVFNHRIKELNPFSHCFSTSDSANRLGSFQSTYRHNINWFSKRLYILLLSIQQIDPSP